MSMEIMFRAPARPRRARSASGTSLNGSAPSNTKVSILPAAASSKISAVSAAPCCGVRPAVIAPRTLPRRNTGSTFACGATCKISASANTVDSALSAKFMRPTMTETEPLPICFKMIGSRPALIVDAILPGSTNTVFHALGVRPVGREVISTTFDLRFWATSRTRRYRTGSSSFKSGDSKMMVFAATASSIVACGKANTSAGSPSAS